MGVLVRSAVAMVLAGAALVSGSSAHAATDPAGLAALDAADKATRVAAATGIDVIQQVKFHSKASLRNFEPQVTAKLPAGSRIRIHETIAADGSFYASVRRMPSQALIGAAGRQTASGPQWATVSMLVPASADTARFHGAKATTVITGLDPEVSPIDDGRLSMDPIDSANLLILPPYSDAFDEGWTTVLVTPQPDGTTLITGGIDANGEDMCTYSEMAMVVGPDNVVRSSRWVRDCPSRGVMEFSSTATYGPSVKVQPPMKPTMPAKKALNETRP